MGVGRKIDASERGRERKENDEGTERGEERKRKVGGKESENISEERRGRVERRERKREGGIGRL